MTSPTDILLENINLTKRSTSEMLESGGLTCLQRAVLGLLESAGGGDMKAVDLIINRVDGLLSEKVAVKPIVVEVVDYGVIKGEVVGNGE